MTEPTPYEVLGVAKDAGDTQIKAAYRRLSAKLHPDNLATGDINQFRAMKNAYDILSDPDRRKRFDATGRQDESRVTPARVQAFLRDTMKNAIHAQRKDGTTDDPTRENILQKLIISMGQSRQLVQQERHETYKKLERAQRIAERLVTTADEDILGPIMEAEIKELRAELLVHEDALELSMEAERVFRLYGYKVGPGPEGHFSPGPTVRAERTSEWR